MKLTAVICGASFLSGLRSWKLSKGIPTEGRDPLEEYSSQLLKALHTWLASLPIVRRLLEPQVTTCSWLYCAPVLAFSWPFPDWHEEDTSLSWPLRFLSWISLTLIFKLLYSLCASQPYKSYSPFSVRVICFAWSIFSHSDI